MPYLDGLSFCALLLLLIGVGVYSGRKVKREQAYLVADRRAGWFALMATLVMTEFNTATLISFSSMGYFAGLWALSLPLVFLVGLLFYALTVAKKWHAFAGYSVAEVFSQRYGKGVGMMASLSLLVAMTGFTAAYVKSLCLLFAPLFPLLNGWVLSGLLVAIVLIMSLRGGLVSVIATDVVSFVIIVLFFGFLFPLVSSQLPVSVDALPAAQMLDRLPPRFVVSLIILTMFTYILAPWYGQKIFSARSSKVAFWSVICAAIVTFMLYGGAVMATALLRRSGMALPGNEAAFPYVLQILPFGLRGVGYGVLFAASATTLTGSWSAMSAMIVGDYLRDRTPPTVKRARMIVLSMALLSYLLANTLLDSVFDKLILANIPVAALSFALLAAFYWPRVTRMGAYASIVVGLLSGICCYCFIGSAGIYTWYWAIIGIPLTFGAGIVVSFIRGEIAPVRPK